MAIPASSITSCLSLFSVTIMEYHKLGNSKGKELYSACNYEDYIVVSGEVLAYGDSEET